MEALTETGSAPDAGGGTPRIFPARGGLHTEKSASCLETLQGKAKSRLTAVKGSAA